MSASTGSATTDDTTLTQRALDAFESRGAEALESLLADHPERAREIRARLVRLQDLGLIRSAEGEVRLEAIGPYQPLECIGRGGMGEVWKAEQREPVQRLVALHLNRFVDGALAGKDRVEGLEGDPARLGDLADLGVVVALFGEDPARRLEDQLTIEVRLGLAGGLLLGGFPGLICRGGGGQGGSGWGGRLSLSRTTLKNELTILFL